MRLNLPKNDKKYHWTQHCIRKMLFYGLTADRVKRIIRNPKRMEEGIAENTLAAMSPYGRASGRSISRRDERSPEGRQPYKGEIWTMYAVKGQKKIIITAWRYPGVSPIREQVPIPADILEELKRENLLMTND